MGAIYENEGNANSYQIVNDISTSPGQVVQPFSWSPSNWFDTGQGANFECQTNGLDYCSQFSFTPCEGCNQGFDLAVAENQIQNNEYTDESLYEFQKQLWNVLDLTSSYRDSFPELDSFYVANQYSLLAAVINVERTVFDLFDMAPSVIQTIKNNQIQIEADINSMKTHIDLILSNTLTPAQKITERTVVQALQNNIQTLSDYCTSALSIAKNSRILSADNINIVNGSIGDDEIYVTNDKLVNEIYLSTIAKGITFFDDEQILILEDIAQQCPLAGGNAVWRARSIYSLIDDQATYDDALACLNSGILLRKKHTDPNSLRPLRSSSIFPNPASDEATLTYSLPTDSKANLLISDEFGRDILHYTLDSKEAQFMFSTKLLNEGMYYYKIMVGDQIIEAGKISILR